MEVIMPELKCNNCNETFIKKKIDPRSKTSFCSKKCQSAGQVTKKEVTCKACNKIFLKQPAQISENNFCSRSCAAKINNQGVQRNKPKKKSCAVCSTVFETNKNHSSRTCCEKCFENYGSAKKPYLRELTISELQSKVSVAGKHPSWASSNIRNLNRSWNKALLDLGCQNCGYSKHIELCHIKAVSDFSKDTQLSIVNHPDNILVLCRNCHWEFDNKLLSLDDIPKR
jgi:hypothetical protein